MTTLPPGLARVGDVPGLGGLPTLYVRTPLFMSGSFSDRLGAAWRDTMLGALLQAPGGSVLVDDTFDAVAAARQVELPEERSWLASARSRAEFDMIVEHLMVRRRDRALAAQQPLMHAFFAGALDPTNYVAVGTPWVRAATGGMQRALRGAAVTGVTVGATEVARAALDHTVKLDEVTGAIAGATVLGGMVGRLMRPTSPAAVGVGRYLDGQPVQGDFLVRGEGPAFLSPEPLPGVQRVPSAAARAEIGIADDWGTAGTAGAAATPGARVGQTGDYRPVETGTGLERIGMSPLARLVNSSIDAVGEAIHTLTQIPHLSRRNQRGLENPGNVASDQYRWQSRLAAAMQDYDEAFADLRGVGRVRASVEDLAGRPGAQARSDRALPASEFDARVWRRLHGQEDDPLPQVNRAAVALRRVYDELGDDAAASGMFKAETVRTPKRWETDAGEIVESYVNRVWDRAAILADRVGFEKAISEWLARSGGNVANARKIVESILTDRPFRAIDDEHVGRATSSYARKFDAPSTVFERWLVRDPRELLAHYVRTMGPDVSLMRRAGGVDARGLLDSATEEWFLDIGRRTGRNGRQVFEDMQRELEALRGKTAAAYKALGDDPRLEDIAKVREAGEADKRRIMDVAKSELGASGADWDRMLAELDDLRAVRDLLRGTYGQMDDAMDWVPRTLASARKVAMMASLTGLVSQLSDVGALVLKEGFARTFGTAIAGLQQGLDTLRMGAKEARLAGTALDMMNAGRALSMSDLAPDISGRHTLFERVLDRATRASFFVNLMNPWSSFMKGWAGLVVASRIADDVDRVAGLAVRKDVVAKHARLMAEDLELDYGIDGRGAVRIDPAQVPAARARRARIVAERAALPGLSAPELMLAQVEQAGILGGKGIHSEVTAAAPHIAASYRKRYGRPDANVSARLARAGISPEMAAEISAQLGRHQGGRDGLRLPNTERWSNAEAREAFRRALAEDVDNAIVSADGPGRSLFLSRPVGQTLGMFHAYGQAVLGKLIVPALQEKEARLLAGVALMVGAGAISDHLRRAAIGDERPLGTGQLLGRAIDRSGVTGWFGQLYQAASSLADTRFGPGFVGAAQPAPDGMPVSMTDPDGLVRALGPAAATARNLVDLGFRTATMDWGQETARDARRLLPLNNVTHLHFAFSELERALAGRGESRPAASMGMP